jgi:hypothetical protein
MYSSPTKSLHDIELQSMHYVYQPSRIWALIKVHGRDNVVDHDLLWWVPCSVTSLGILQRHEFSDEVVVPGIESIRS